MGTNSNESFRLYSFSVMGDMKSNKYFAILYIGEPIWDIIGLLFGKPSTNALWIFGKPYKRAGFGPSGVSIVLISQVTAFFSYKILSANFFFYP